MNFETYRCPNCKTRAKKPFWSFLNPLRIYDEVFCKCKSLRLSYLEKYNLLIFIFEDMSWAINSDRMELVVSPTENHRQHNSKLFNIYQYRIEHSFNPIEFINYPLDKMIQKFQTMVTFQ